MLMVCWFGHADLVVPLVHMLSEAEFDIKKEAAWAISNATSGGRAEQIHTLVQAGAIRPLCDLLTCSDPRIITVALEGIENILKARPSPSSCLALHEMCLHIADIGISNGKPAAQHRHPEPGSSGSPLLEAREASRPAQFCGPCVSRCGSLPRQLAVCCLAVKMLLLPWRCASWRG